MVEDDQVFADLVRRMIELDGHRLVHVTDGVEALRIAPTLQPNLILLDLILPGDLDGWETLHSLRADPATSHIPIVVVSSLDDRDVVGTLGATDYLMKPVCHASILSLLERFAPRPLASILIVDDDRDTRDVIVRMVERADLVVRAVDSGDAALRAITHDQPDLVILDLMMPGMDGFQVLETIRSSPITRSLPVIVLTTKDLTPAESEWLRQRTVAVLAKSPLRVDALAAEVRAALAARQDTREPAASGQAARRI